MFGLAVILSSALAASGAAAAPTVVNDRVGDTRVLAGGEGDILRAVTSSTPTVVRVRLILAQPTPASSVYVNLRVGAARYQTRRGQLYRVGTFDVEDGAARRVGVAPARASGRVVTVTIPRRALGDPKVVMTQAMVLEGLDPVDLAPNRSLARHVLTPSRATAPRGPRLVAPARVVPGRPFRVTLSGFPRGASAFVQLQPTEFRGGNAFGVALPGRFRTTAAGGAVLRPRWPARFAACAGASDCTTRPWTRGQRVDITVCAGAPGRAPVCRRAVTRIR